MSTIAPFYGTIAVFGLIILFVVLGYFGVPLWAWSIYGTIVLAALTPPLWIWIIFSSILLILNVPILRRSLLTSVLFKTIQNLKLLPNISETEQAAIDAGTVWIEGEFFSGKPNFDRIHTEPYPEVTPEIQTFLDGPVEQVCRMATDWEIHQRKDLPPEVWAYLKRERFFGMMIPQEYGGLGFSYLAYSSVMVKLASRSFIHTATVGVTNSLGPAKLLLNYGTESQKDYYLPRLANGDEIPCFALTEPTAGSDAASITSSGVVFQGDDGKLYLRLNFRKRYITLGAIATLIGLAFKLRDPDNLLGKGETVGITCALIPADTPGIILGKRHDPMGVPFYNSPIEGHDVIVPIDNIIGGIEQAGQGWKMLMQTLAAGRGISFPASATGITKLVTRVTSAHALIRRQFGLSIGRFEGVEEPLARIGGLTYLLDAARIYTCGAVDRGEKPSVVSAIAKYQFTDLARKLVNDGMDVLGGSGICRGPRNLLANIYIATPIPITVEGSNIITRTLMIFGQGAIRCHPYLYREIQAIHQNDVAMFDAVIWHHVGLTVQNGFRTALLHLTRGALAQAPVKGRTARYYRKLAWSSAAFALLSDLALIGFGGSLKRQEKLTGRFADILSWMYLGTATLRRFEAEGERTEDLPLVDWAMQYSFAQIQAAFEGIFSNLPIPSIVRKPLLAWWRLNPIGSLPSDELGHQIAQQLQTSADSGQTVRDLLQQRSLRDLPQQISLRDLPQQISLRDRLTAGIYLPAHPDEALGRIEQAFRLSTQAEGVFKTIKTAIQNGQLPKGKPEQLIEVALRADIITEEAAALVRQAEAARDDAIQVDAFTLEDYQQGRSSLLSTQELMRL